MFLKTKQQIGWKLHQKKQEKKEDLNMILTNARYVKNELEERTMEIYGYCMYEWQILQ